MGCNRTVVALLFAVLLVTVPLLAPLVAALICQLVAVVEGHFAVQLVAATLAVDSAHSSCTDLADIAAA